MHIHIDHTPAAAAMRTLAQLLHCCEGAAMYGPHRCTCWEPIFQTERSVDAVGRVIFDTPAQVHPIPSAPVCVRFEPCHDCAYRPDSPERRGDDTVNGDQDELARIVRDGQVFWCHQGMRAPIAWRHPAGITVDVPPVGYQPLTTIDPATGHSVPYKLDGTPADVCAGWAVRRLHHMQHDQPDDGYSDEDANASMVMDLLDDLRT